MASRLTVVVSQAAGGSPSMADLEETLVAELMMAPGMDATMIGPLEHVTLEGTDRLCLNSFQHSFALVTWLPAGDVLEHWERLELQGHVAPLGEAGRPSATRVHHVQLDAGSTVASVLKQLGQILTDRNARTVSIQLPAGTQKAPAPGRSSRPPSGPAAEPSEGSQPQAEEGLPGPVTESTRQAEAAEAESDEEWASLDRLVDDFEALDL